MQVRSSSTGRFQMNFVLKKFHFLSMCPSRMTSIAFSKALQIKHTD